MIDVESVFASEVEAIVPAPGAGGADWQDVEQRAGLPAARRRRVALAAALLAAIFAAAALADAFGGFGTWLSGEPGKPASPAAQRAFARSIRTWVGFPQGAQLRELAKTTADGETYTLYGFRGSGSLCLRLDVTGREAATDLVCPPLAQLRGSPAPALPAEVDYPVGAGRRIANGPFDFTLPGATVTFGIVADSVTHVKVAHSDGRSIDAVVSGDAFLAVDDHPSPTERVLAISAGDGRTTVRVPFSSSAPATRAVAGPTRVQRFVHGGAIRWMARRRPRGTAVPKNLHGAAAVGGSALFAREITPSRTAPERIVISIAPAGDRYFGGHLRNKKVVCSVVVGGRYPGAGGCWPAGRLFSTGPFAVGVSHDASSRYLTLAGLAGDDVARLALFLDNGTVFKVPLHDNGFVVEAPTSGYPLNLVAYD
ncbi:MAG TPA: hypothetical protein VFB17_01595, partial [Gaiellaceae bacterium]|nr:hypothetical protein [Gaiellaceae bacterium]